MSPRASDTRRMAETPQAARGVARVARSAKPMRPSPSLRSAIYSSIILNGYEYTEEDDLYLGEHQ